MQRKMNIIVKTNIYITNNTSHPINIALIKTHATYLIVGLINVDI